MHIHQPISVSARCAAILLSASPPPYTGPGTPLNDATFQAALEQDDFDGLTVVKFFAPWCRTCRATSAPYAKIAEQVSDAHAASDVRFFEVNFKEEKQLSLRERVFALPAIHFYCKTLGRINRFTISPAGGAKKLKGELERYLGTPGDATSGHLAYLRTLRRLAADTDTADPYIAQSLLSPVSPLVRYKGLVGVLQALVNAETYLDRALNTETGDDQQGVLKSAIGSNEGYQKELEALFKWIDANGDGYIDASELAAVAAAIEQLGGEEDGEGKDAGALLDLYSALLQQASQSVTKWDGTTAAAAAEEEDEEEVPSGDDARLDFPSFARLMTSKTVADFRSPESELKPAFEALDADGNGVITREELMKAMEAVSEHLPQVEMESLLERSGVAFEAMDVDGSGTLDYEEFVAVLSGVNYNIRDEEAMAKA